MMPSSPKRQSRRWSIFVWIISLAVLQALFVSYQLNSVAVQQLQLAPRDRMLEKPASPSPQQRVAPTNNNNSASLTYATSCVPANATFAYAFLIAGCSASHPGYRGFLWGAMVSVEILKAHGSRADMVVLVQLQYNTSDTTIPEEDLLRSMGIRVVYIPPPTSSQHTFYDAVLQKFRILELVEYEKVLFLDADIMPIDTQFDYLFESPLLRPNIVRATRAEPANAGFFVLAPGPGKWEQMQEVVDRREIDALERNLYRVFDFDKGWGADLRPEGGWKGTHRKGSKYNFWFGAAGECYRDLVRKEQSAGDALAFSIPYICCYYVSRSRPFVLLDQIRGAECHSIDWRQLRELGRESSNGSACAGAVFSRTLRR